jgi:hypothetical protein
MYVLCVSLFPYPKRQNFSPFTPTLCVVGNAKAKSSRAGLLAIFAATTSLIFAPILSTLRLRLRVRPWLTTRVSSHDQKEDLERQKQVLESYCAAQGWTFELVADLGSGMNYRKRGLQKLLNQIIAGDVGRIVLNHKDRLLRFGAELVFAHL